MPSKQLIKLHKLLKQQKLTISFAESATAGRMAAELSLIPESGDVLKGGIVCYDADVKEELLGVPKVLLEKFTPESVEVTRELAERLGTIIKADIQVAITGLPMPGGSETEIKPVGTMFIDALIKDRHISSREIFKGTAEEIVLQTIDHAAELLFKELNNS